MKFYHYIILVLALIIIPFILSMCFEFYIQRYIEHKRITITKRPLKKDNFFKKLWFDFPRRLVKDKFDIEPDTFGEFGLHLIVGEQGSGKTITTVYLLRELKRQYPFVKIKTNMYYSHQDDELKSWHDLVFSNNGILGEIDVLDEIQNWFNSLQSKDFPVEMFQEVSQQRKQRKMIMGTSQVWQRVAKPIREQVRYVYKPTTLFGCLTIVRQFKPDITDDGSIDKLKFRKWFFFVHTDDLRNSFDTYHKIEVMSLSGFKPQQDHITSWSRGGSPVDSPRPADDLTPKFFSKKN